VKNIEAMKGKLYGLVDEARAVLKTAETEDRSMSGEEKEKHERLMTDIRELEKEILTETELQRIEGEKAKTDPDPERTRAEWRSLGEFVSTIYLNPNDKRLRPFETELRQPPPQEMTTGGAGGFLVPDQFSQQLLEVTPEEAIIRPRATVFSGGSDADFNIPALGYTAGANMFAGAEVEWIGEGELKPETSIHFKQITLHPFEVAAHVRVTDRLIRNAPAIEQIVMKQLRLALIAAEEEAFLVNAAAVANAPTPIIGDVSTIEVNRAGGGAVVWADLVEMFWQWRGSRGVWIVNRQVVEELMNMQAPGAGQELVWQPNARDGNPGSLFGMPVLISDHSPALGVLGDVVLADLSYYLIRDGIGVSMAISPHVHFTSNISVIKAFKTVDGAPWLLGPLPTNPQSSPFIVLDVP